jgi:hypothetical protein
MDNLKKIKLNFVFIFLLIVCIILLYFSKVYQVILISKNNITSSNFLLDAPFFAQIFFQDPASDLMESMVHFHQDVLFIMFLISILIT